MNKRQREVEKAKLAAEAQELKTLKAIYEEAAEQIASKIKISDGKIEIYLENWDDLSDDDKTLYRSQIYQKKYQRALLLQIEGFLEELNSGQFKSIDEYLKACYEMGFIGAMYDIAGQDIPLIIPIDQKKVVIAVRHNSKLKKELYETLGEDVDSLKKRISSSISRGIATADSYENIARNISNASNVGFNNAMRITRTEGHRVHCNSAHDAQLAAKDAGADVVKQWDSTLDGKTRTHHRLLDGQIREVEEPFNIGNMKPMYPADFGRPEEDINCRCTILQRARWALDEDELETLKERAAFYGLDKTDSFNDFKKKYLRANTKDETLTNRRQQRMAARKATKQTTNIPDFSSMEHEDVLKWANSNLQTPLEGLKGANKEFVKEAVSALAEFENKMGGTIEGLSVKFGGLPNNVFAKYDDKTKTLLLKKTGNLKAFEDKLKAENARYRAKWKRNKDYHATDTFKGTIFHELGHAIDVETGQNLSRLLGANAELYEKSVKVSAYAGTQQGVRVTKASEAWAENFAAYMAGGANAKKVPDEIKEMIESYFKKPLANAGKNSTIVSGAISGARNPLSQEAKEHAKRYYGLVRSMTTDVAKISKTTGIPKKDIQDIKDFIFNDKHDLGNGELEYFEPDYMMAESWRRLIEGKPEKHDYTLISHEIMEKRLMDSGMPQDEAHIKTSAKYNYDKEAKEYYAEIEKHKKK